MSVKHKTTQVKGMASREVQKRAEEIRSHWSPIERVQRMGLPPDVPARMREFILGAPTGWKLVPAAAQAANPFRS